MPVVEPDVEGEGLVEVAEEGVRGREGGVGRGDALGEAAGITVSMILEK